MSFEQASIPEDHELPLDIQESERHAHGAESVVWKTSVNASENEQRLIALKQVHRKEFADDGEMRKSKAFYDFLKNFPGFGDFVPDTLYFKARMHPGEEPQEYAIQNFTEGRSIDAIDDEDLYKDPELVRQLLGFANGAIAILEKAREDKIHKPDLGTAGTAALPAIIKGNYFANPRYSSNVVIGEKPDKNGQRVFFVDTGVNVDERTNSTTETIRREIGSRLQEIQLKLWAKRLAGMLHEEELPKAA